MRRRRGRNPRSGRKRRRKTQVWSDGEVTVDTDSDFCISDSEDEVDESLPPPPPPPLVVHVPDSPTHRRRSSGRRRREGSPPLVWEIWEKENKRWIDEYEKKKVVEADEQSIAEAVEPSSDIVLPLLRFQKEWLFWALKQEELEVRGGVLADEMGMGKTIQAISLVLTARNVRSSNIDIQTHDMPSCSLLTNKCTLVICPVVAVIQWVGEIERHTEKGSARVLVYHGPKRSNAAYDFNRYDFVITTYSTIECDYRKYIMPPKERCQFCERMFYPKKMRVHLKYYCGPHARRTEKQSKQEKKMKQVKGKEFDVEEGCLSDLEKEKGQGAKKGGRKANKRQDESTVNPGVLDKGKSILHSVKWERIILDEAHFIKDRRSNTARAVFALESSYKWALSGTPLQNRVGELYSLVRFLQIYPYSFYFCKDCDCKILDYRILKREVVDLDQDYSLFRMQFISTKQCTDCPHSTVRHFCWWNRYITKPIQTGRYANEGRRALILLKERLLKSIVLRRTKKGRAADLALPPRLVTLRRNSLDKNEQEFYEALYTQSRIQFDTYVMAGTLMNNYAHIFDLLTRLRQAVDHPYLVVYSRTAEVPGVCKDNTVKDNCGICHDLPEDMVVTSCEHIFCKACLIEYSATLGNVSCPSCSKPLTVDLTLNNSGEKISKTISKGYKQSGILSRLNVSDFKTSTKIDALREEIRNMVEVDGSAKGIVFSQFTSFLDLIKFSLQMSGIKCVQLVGSMSLAEREKAIKMFTDDVDCKIFLMSLKAGGVALNLTVASHVFLMDPWWNPAVERQAQDRIHRIGQYKPIRTVRFVIEDTIEERILKLQEKKELVFEGTVGDSSEAMAKLTEADLRFLFHI